MQGAEGDCGDGRRGVVDECGMLRANDVTDAGRAPNGWVGCFLRKAYHSVKTVIAAAGTRVQRFGAPEYDSRDESIRIWSSKALRVPCWRWWRRCHEDKSAVCYLRTLDAALTGVLTRRGDAKGTRGRNVPVFSPEEREFWHGGCV